MSRRTSEASKAIRQAWIREQQLVQEGRGTRDWTPEQQQDICNSGKAHDADGKAFEGHHMQNAVSHPEHQGGPENIQFLTHDEHFAAHNYNWQNPTNGYYDYLSGKTLDFGAQKYVPCKILELSEPIHSSIVGEHVSCNKPTKDEIKDDGRGSPKNECASENESTRGDIDAVIPVYTTEETIPSADAAPDVVTTPLWTRAVKALSDFNEKHPIIVDFAKAVGGAVASAVVGSVVSSISRGSVGTRSDSSISFTSSTCLGEEATTPIASRDMPPASNYPSERLSPREHQVSGYDRIQNGKVVHVNPYKRGHG